MVSATSYSVASKIATRIKTASRFVAFRLKYKLSATRTHMIKAEHLRCVRL